MMDLIRREIRRALASVRQPVRAVLQSSVTSTRVQRVNAEGLAGEPLQDMELLQQFGFTSGLPAGAQLIVIPLGGRTSAAVVVATEHGAYRFKVDAQGEAALYNQWGDVIHLKQDRSIRVQAQLKVDVAAPLATFSGDATVAGALAVTGNITSAANITAAGNMGATGNVTAGGSVADQGGAKTMAAMRAVYNTHTQNDPQGGVVGVPNQLM